MREKPRLLVTGFSPFPGAPENPTQALIHVLAAAPPEKIGAASLRAVVLPTDYRRSWARLRHLYAGFNPDIVVHFGLSLRAGAIHVEHLGRNTADPEKRDAAGFAPRSGRAARSGPPSLDATFPVEPIVAALARAGVPARASDDAGAYVCNATLYRSLVSAPAGRRVGFIHVPPAAIMPAPRLLEAAFLLLQVSTNATR